MDVNTLVRVFQKSDFLLLSSQSPLPMRVATFNCCTGEDCIDFFDCGGLKVEVEHIWPVTPNSVSLDNSRVYVAKLLSGNRN